MKYKFQKNALFEFDLIEYFEMPYGHKLCSKKAKIRW